MADESKQPLRGRMRADTPDQYLAEQGDLTAVERFSRLHDEGKVPSQSQYYQALLPSAPPGPGQQYAFEVDLDACSGCKACVTGCHNRNGLMEGETWRAVGLLRGTVSQFQLARPMDSKEVAAAAGTVLPQTAPITFHKPVPHADSAPVLFQQHVTAACHHCVDPACLTGCPVKAYEKEKDTGIVRHLDDQCIGCQYCVYKCPYGVPQYSAELGIVRKCDLCASRLKSGEAPACVQSCPNEAIRIVVVTQADASANPGEHFKIPSAPDAQYTRPTTRYVSRNPLPPGLSAADASAIVAQPPEHPLTAMLVLTQMAAGTLAVLAVLAWRYSGIAPGFILLLSVFSTAMAGVGLGIGTLHLGRPLYAFRAFLGLRTSWLSREVIVLGLFVKLAALQTLWMWWKGAWPPLSWAVAVAGALGVLCSGMVYKDTPRAWWKSMETVPKFFVTAALSGLAAVWALAQITAERGAFLERGVVFGTAVLGLAALKAALESRVYFHAGRVDDSRLGATVALLTNEFRYTVRWRMACLAAGVLSLLTSTAWPESVAGIVVSWAGWFLIVAGEVLERHLFFRAVAPPKMPGAV